MRESISGVRLPSSVESGPPSSPGHKTSTFNLSIPGLTHANERGRSSRTRAVIWIVLSLVGLTLTLYQVQTVFTNYWSYPINTKVGKGLLKLRAVVRKKQALWDSNLGSSSLLCLIR